METTSLALLGAAVLPVPTPGPPAPRKMPAGGLRHAGAKRRGVPPGPRRRAAASAKAWRHTCDELAGLGCGHAAGGFVPGWGASCRGGGGCAGTTVKDKPHTRCFCPCPQARGWRASPAMAITAARASCGPLSPPSPGEAPGGGGPGHCATPRAPPQSRSPRRCPAKDDGVRQGDGKRLWGTVAEGRDPRSTEEQSPQGPPPRLWGNPGFPQGCCGQGTSWRAAMGRGHPPAAGFRCRIAGFWAPKGAELGLLSQRL